MPNFISDCEDDPRFLRFDHNTIIGKYLRNTPEPTWNDLCNKYIQEGILEKFVYKNASEASEHQYLDGLLFKTAQHKLAFILIHG